MIDIGMLSEDKEQLYLNVSIEADILEGPEIVQVCNKKINQLPWKTYQKILFTSFSEGNSTWKEPRVFCPGPSLKSKEWTKAFLVTFRRDHINDDDVNDMKVYNKSMTGMKVSWSILSISNSTVKTRSERSIKFAFYRANLL